MPDEISQSSSHKEEHYDKKVMSPLFNVVDNYNSDSSTKERKKERKKDSSKNIKLTKRQPDISMAFS